MSDHPPISKRLRDIRVAADLTQAALAERLGCTSKRVSNIEAGRRRPSLELVAEWANACGLACTVLLEPADGHADAVRAASEALAATSPEARAIIGRLLPSVPGSSAADLALLDDLVSAWQRRRDPRDRVEG